MREIIFRGLTANLLWITGNLITTPNGTFIMDQAFDIDDFAPDYNAHSVGCGLEDCGCGDRYEGAEYGFQEGVSRTLELIPEFNAVIPKTVGQRPGVKDKSGKYIYEGDIVKTQNKYITKVVYGHNFDERGALRSGLSFIRVGLEKEPSRFEDQDIDVYSCGSSILYDLESLEVIGNIHENPELME